ncbi:nitroreductase/quinone reductase family protein [Cellulomonas sp. S1-8]|uniref:nitroreductase/quinone reductase family protein n=1 Tax=Cellulomonas sp. S1-8 TaxID=2904790 RepID=UPI0022441B68|nr:nitroreductase/quinone reductase family protein [Cellulomonas sp. S1-8]UZN03643.1 nitroreductase family deazaflavin-dependent oxidoreductase [Cellulomonas sp. S1-8]
MSFHTPTGTRGARFPLPAPVVRLVNRFTARRVRSTGGRALMGGMDVLVLTTVGAKSGEERSTPLAWFPGGDGTWLVVASAAGQVRNPAWFHNLAAHPDRVRIELDGQRIDVTAEQLHDDERARAWADLTAAGPQFGKYAEATDRELPVVRLRRRPDAA